MKRKFTFLMTAMALMIAIIGSGAEAWGQSKGTATTTLTNANIVAAGDPASGYTLWNNLTDGNNYSYSAYAIKNKHSNATSAYHFLQIKKYASPTAYYIQLPTFSGDITQIKMTVSSSSKPMDGGGNTATLYFSASNSTSASGTGVVSGTGDSSITIDASSLNLKTGYITSSGAIRIWDIEITYTTGGPTQLTKPTLAVTAGNAKVTPTWGAVSNASSYTIEYATENTFESPTTITNATSGTDITGLENGTEYFFRLKAVGDGTNYSDSEWSETQNATPIGATFYTITISPTIQNGNVTSSANSATAGTEITLTATPNTDYEFGAWNVKDANNTPITVTDNKFTMPESNVTVSATFNPIQKTTYTLVTSTADLTVGDKLLIVGTALSSEQNVALGWQDANNRKSANVIISNNSIEAVPATSNSQTTKPFEITLGGTTDSWTLFDDANNGYLYAASSSSNYLRTQETNDENGQWTITIEDNIASITANGENTRNQLKQNGNIFSCYASGQTAVALYKKSVAKAAIPTLTESQVFTTKPFEVTITNNESGATVYYTIDGSDPTTATETSFTGASTIIQINQTTTVKAMAAIDGKAISDIASATYSEQKLDPNNQWSLETYTATIGGENTFPAFSTDSDGTVTYSSSNNNAATINESTGEINLLAAGVTTITASTTETTAYMAGSASYELTVVESALTTMDQIFAKATAVGSTATNVTVTFNNWVISGVSNKNAYLTDGTKGLIIYQSDHGFEVGDILSGTVECTIQLYNGSSELTNLTSASTGLTVTEGGSITPVTMTIDQITSGVYTGAVIKIENLLYNGTDKVLSDGTNTITPYKTLYSDMSFTDGKYYNVTGVYLLYGSKKEILPRDAEDIEVLSVTEYSITLNQATGGTISADKETAAAGVEVTLSYELEQGYEFGSWTVLDGESQEVTVTDNKFTMPASDVEVEATFNQVSTYTITYSNNGSTSQSVVNVGENTLQTPSNIPSGFSFVGWATEQISGIAESATCFTTYNVTSNITLYAVFATAAKGGTSYRLSPFAPVDGDNVIVAGKNDDKYYGLWVVGSTVTATELTFNNGIVTNEGLIWSASYGTYGSTTVYDGIILNNGTNPLHINSSALKVASGNANATMEFPVSGDGFNIYSNQNTRWMTFDGTTFGVTAEEASASTLYFFMPITYSNFCTSVTEPTLPIPEEGGELTSDATIPSGQAFNLTKPVIIPEGKTLTVNGVLGNNNPENLIINDGGQVIINNAGVCATVKRGITNHGSWSKDANPGWYFIASPMTDATVEEFVTNSGETNETGAMYDLYRWEGANDKPWYNYRQHTSDFGTIFESGRGYLAAYNTTTEFTFATGTLTPGTEKTWELNYAENGGFKNLALLGNPFAHNMDWANVIVEDVYNGFATVNSETGAITYAAEGTISSRHGFFVETTGEEPTLYYCKSAKSRGNENRFINVMVSNAEGNDNTIILFDGGKGGFNKIDNFNENIATVYTTNDGNHYGIQSFGEEVTMIPVAFHASTTGYYTISLKSSQTYEGYNDFDYLHLIDNMKGEEIDMLLEDGYRFIGTPNDNPNRFTVKLHLNGIDENEDGNENFVYQYDNNLIINGEGTLQVIDMLGRIVINRNVNGETVSISGLTTGAYIVRMIGNDVKSQKIIIR